jgi:hypothetical protein
MKRIARLRAVITAIVVVAFMAIAVGVASAAITPASCTNNGGNTAPGQQPTCTGSGQTQQPATNPAGNAPPGQQP